MDFIYVSLVTTCLVMTVASVWKSIQKLSDPPTSTRFSTNSFENTPLPSFMVCFKPSIKYSVMNQLGIAVDNPYFISILEGREIAPELLPLTLGELYENISYTRREMIYSCFIGTVEKKNACENFGTWNTQYTMDSIFCGHPFSCKCWTFRPFENFTFSFDTSEFLYHVTLNHRKLDLPPSSMGVPLWVVYLQNSNLTFVDEKGGDTFKTSVLVRYGVELYVNLKMEKYLHLNRMKSPCVEQADYDMNMCKYEVMYEAIQETYAKTNSCTFDWLASQVSMRTCAIRDMTKKNNSFVNPLQTKRNLRGTRLLMSKIQREISRRCHAPCEYWMYEPIKQDLETKSERTLCQMNRTFIRLGVQGGKYLEFQEQISYDMNQFLGECGGNIGMFLGFSVLSLYDSFIRVKEMLRKRCQDTAQSTDSKN